MKKVLIANRGEIAIRIISTCKKLNLQTVAIYSDADKNYPHVELADESYTLSGNEARDSYLNIEKILAIIRKCGADAVHPGYGFLSESAEFAERLEQQDITFIGPRPETLLLLGSKERARVAAIEAGIPVLPGYDDTDQADPVLLQEASKLGTPFLIKACAGGGGKGMRLVTDIRDFHDLLYDARREAKAFFGDDKVILEKLLPHSRHIEVQLAGDRHGKVLHFFERDCSLQRRYQKIIEEAPAPFLSKKLRANILDAAVSFGKKVLLESLATVEFLVPLNEEHFYFLEANPRIQVEHPITEAYVGVDLIELQLKIAQGKKLALSQKSIRGRGSAIEMRVYAEAPQKNFAPSTGRIKAFALPALCHDMQSLKPYKGKKMRADHLLKAGVTISTYYDSLLCKLIVKGKNRDEALERAKSSLDNLAVFGVETNALFLKNLLGKETTAKASYTKLIDEHLESFLKAPQINALCTNAAISYLLAPILAKNLVSRDPFDTLLFFRPNTFAGLEAGAPRTILAESFIVASSVLSQPVEITASLQSLKLGPQNTFEALLNDIRYYGEVEIKEKTGGIFVLLGTINKRPFSSSVFLTTNEAKIITDCVLFSASDKKLECDKAAETEDTKIITSHLPGKVIKLKVNAGDSVNASDVLLVIESMKMEHAIAAPRAARVRNVCVSLDDVVKEGEVLVELD